MSEIKWGAHFPAEAMDAINSLMAEREKLRAEIERLRADRAAYKAELEVASDENERLRDKIDYFMADFDKIRAICNANDERH